ncbi:MAG: efflux RND transporter periplasmic adaptor subunit [Planctomycetales bacterium]
MTGTIVEKNVAVGDYINNELDIFKLADLRRLDVLVHAYEEDLPILEGLPMDRRSWSILLKADPFSQPLRGSFDRISKIIDPYQHTALVMGWVDNAQGQLRVGQFVTARVDLPIPAGEVAVPIQTLIDLDGHSYVFVRSASEQHKYTRRRVHPVRRFAEIAALRSDNPPNSGADAWAPLLAGDWVVTTAGIQHTAELMARQAAAGRHVAGHQ